MKPRQFLNLSICFFLLHFSSSPLWISEETQKKTKLNSRMSLPTLKSRKRKRAPKLFNLNTFCYPGCPIELKGAFRDNIRVFLQECAEMEEYDIDSMTVWCTLLVQETRGVVFPLYTIEENVKLSKQPFCDHCRCCGNFLNFFVILLFLLIWYDVFSSSWSGFLLFCINFALFGVISVANLHSDNFAMPDKCLLVCLCELNSWKWVWLTESCWSLWFDSFTVSACSCSWSSLVWLVDLLEFCSWCIAVEVCVNLASNHKQFSCSVWYKMY